MRGEFRSFAQLAKIIRISATLRPIANFLLGSTAAANAISGTIAKISQDIRHRFADRARPQHQPRFGATVRI
jgi:hypothetical protein